MRTLSLAGLVTALVAVSVLPAADWPQWRGPQRTAVSAETGLLKSWPKDGPKLVWTFETAGNGYSAPAVVGGQVFALGTRDKDEVVLCLDEAGKEKWVAKIAPIFDFKGNQWSRGPNSSPLVEGDRVYALGSQGELVCLNKADGNEVWRKDLPKELDAQINVVGGGPANRGWGFCWSPLVDGDRLVITPGGPKGLFASLEKSTGKVIWQSKDAPDQATYSSPLAATIAGVKQYLTVVQDGVVAVDAKTGDFLWRHKVATPYPDIVATTPIVSGDSVYVSVGYGAGAELLQLAMAGGKFTVKSAWAEREIGAKQGGVVLLDGDVYGANEDRNWLCQELATGTIKGKSNPRKGVKMGGVLAADGRLYTVDETGVVAMMPATPGPLPVLSKFKLPQESKIRKPSGKVWTHPVLSDGKLYARDQELIFCFQVK